MENTDGVIYRDEVEIYRKHYLNQVFGSFSEFI
jgi:hypothetical protein